MNTNDRKRFAAMLTACAENYGKAISDQLADLWWEGLKGHDIGAVEAAFQRHIFSPDTGQFMPKPADILRMLIGTSVDAAQVAWAAVDAAVRSSGPYVSVTFDDRITMRVLQEMGGWILLCSKRADEWPFVANEFRTRYQGYRSRGEVPLCAPRLAGIIEAENSANGLPAPIEHVLIGNPEACAAIAAGPAGPARIGLQRVLAAPVMAALPDGGDHG